MLRHVVLIAALITAPVLATADTTLHVGVGTSSLQLDFLYSDYGVDRVVVEREASRVGEQDLLVALRLARVSGIDLDLILRWRCDRVSWDTITRRCHRDARYYYMELPAEASRPPYGRAHGYWKKHPKGDLVLTDDEIREFVVVQAVAEHCKMTPAEVVRRRAGGESPKGIASGRSHREDAAPHAPSGRRGDHAQGKPGKKK